MVVQRGVEVVELRSTVGGVEALLGPDGGDRVTARYVAGCDGPRSTVRRLMGVAWPGRPYRQEAVLADIELDVDLAPGVAHAVAGSSGITFLFPLGEQATWRLLATRDAPDDLLPGELGPPVPPEELQALLDHAGLTAQLTRVPWSARVPLQHRIASRYRTGRAFLVGDAAHTWSPAGGQGMNTGIQDAVNLGWKLAFASGADVRGAGTQPLLDSYELERRPAARRLLAMTNVLFWAEAGTGPVPSFLRATAAPRAARLIPFVLGCEPLVAEAVRRLSQLRAGYRRSPISMDALPGSGGVRAGDRLPDATVTGPAGRCRLHELLAAPGVHVLLDEATEAGVEPLGPFVRQHRVSLGPGPAAVAIRPDGHVGFRGGPAGIADWLDLVHAAANPRASAGTAHQVTAQ